MLKGMRILFITATTLLATATFALAGRTTTTTTTTVSPGGITTIKVAVKNGSTTATLPGIVNITGTDSAGRLVANMGVPVVIAPKSSTTVSRTWTAPKYPTSLTWKAKVVPYRDPAIKHSYSWLYPVLQHRMTDYAKTPTTASCLKCHKIDVLDKKAPMNCYNCHDKKWN